MTKETVIGAQGEITIYRIDAMPPVEGLRPAGRHNGAWIISHSESGHHHLLSGGEVLEREGDDFVARLYATLTEPATLFQDAATPHGTIELPPGLYEFRLAREYDPFLEQARRVAD